jgi:hypothetical protein
MATRKKAPRSDPAHRAAQKVGRPLQASDVVDRAQAKREKDELRKAEQQAEGGHLSSGIGADEP